MAQATKLRFHNNSDKMEFCMRNIFFACCVVACVTSCSNWKDFLKKAQSVLESEGEYPKVAGETATHYLAKTIKDFQTDVSGVLEALSVAENETARANLREMNLLSDDSSDKPVSVSENTVKILMNSQMEKKSFDATTFAQIDESNFTRTAAENLRLKPKLALASDTVQWTHDETEFTVSMLDKMPVRYQGQRGTCASFAGIAQIEALALKAYPNDLSSLDLSEQRFYYMSKPEHWSNGGSASSQGSNTGTGYASSADFQYTYDGVKIMAPPDSQSFNIPLETDCPYVEAVGSTDLQVPQADGCKKGVIKVKEFNGWLKDWTNLTTTAQQIYDFLKTNDYPVVVNTKLSANWEKNDGMITLAGAGGAGASSHASGHAYLIVGARKLDESKFPNEGGMCFIVKNSWGKGWGVNGLSCMTLAWFNAWRYEEGSPTVLDIELDPEEYANAKKNLDAIPEGLEEADPAKKGTSTSGGKKRGKLSVNSFNLNSFDLTSSTDGWTLGAWLANGEMYYKVLYKTEGSKFLMRGILDGDKKMTHEVELVLEGNLLKYYAPTKDKNITFGDIDTSTNVIKLCSMDYSQVCYLNYDAATESLVVGLTEEEFFRDDSEGPYDWKGLTVSGYGIDISHPGDLNTKLDVRFTVDGKTTNPLRFKIDVINGYIYYQGQKIGDYQKGIFCSGDYKSVCRVVIAGEKFYVLFKAK